MSIAMCCGNRFLFCKMRSPAPKDDGLGVLFVSRTSILYRSLQDVQVSVADRRVAHLHVSWTAVLPRLLKGAKVSDGCCSSRHFQHEAVFARITTFEGYRRVRNLTFLTRTGERVNQYGRDNWARLSLFRTR